MIEMKCICLQCLSLILLACQAKKGTCRIDYPTLRVAQCYISDNVYYEIPCPFQGGTNEFIAFFTELNNNFMFRLVNLRGENLPYGYYLHFPT